MKRLIIIIITAVVVIFLYSNIVKAEIYQYKGNNNVYSADDVANVYNSLPQYVKNINPVIYITQYNPYHAAAGAYSNKIWLYSNKNYMYWWSRYQQIQYLRRLLLHEIGHVFWTKINMNCEYWGYIMKLDNNYVNNNKQHYKKNAEDFAETFRKYVEDKRYLQRWHSQRFIIIDMLVRVIDGH